MMSWLMEVKINQNSEITVQKMSRKIIILFFLFFLSSGAIAFISEFLELKWKWLEVIGISLPLTISELLLAISWITPGILIALRVPWFAHAWLEGMGIMGVSYTPWEQLSTSKKISTYFWGLALSAVALVAITGSILRALQD